MLIQGDLSDNYEEGSTMHTINNKIIDSNNKSNRHILTQKMFLDQAYSVKTPQFVNFILKISHNIISLISNLMLSQDIIQSLIIQINPEQMFFIIIY